MFAIQVCFSVTVALSTSAVTEFLFSFGDPEMVYIMTLTFAGQPLRVRVN